MLLNEVGREYLFGHLEMSDLVSPEASLSQVNPKRHPSVSASDFALAMAKRRPHKPSCLLAAISVD
jgi:hypothetical protein